MPDPGSLAARACRPCRKGDAAPGAAEVAALASQVPAWSCDGKRLERGYAFGDFDAAYAFVGRVAAVARAADHHPDIAFGWGWATVALTTHATGGLSENDFIVAARIDALP